MVTKRVFIPGSEWLYFKIYVGSAYSDKLLVYVWKSIIYKINRKQLISKWFFIRYSDPEYHLRIRFRLKDVSYNSEVINLFYKSLKEYVENEIVWKIQIDTYVRELERYSIDLMEYGESIFHIDSNYILQLLKISVINKWSEQKRFLIGLKIIEQYLNSFGYSLERKQQIVQIMDESFKSEFGYNKFNAKQLNEMYRENYHDINIVMEGNYDVEVEQLLYGYFKSITEFSILIKRRINDDKLDNLLPSYIHMMMNRWFRSKNRLYELLSYNFLNRYYKSMIARNLYSEKFIPHIK